jgi:predicted Rossmann fold flavoprotein
MTSHNPHSIAIIGGGPSGLRAADVLSGAGIPISVFDQKPSVGRKFLVAGHGGLNLTHSENLEAFTARYGPSAQRFASLLRQFTPQDLRKWSQELGIETFVGTSGRVFPMEKKAAPLLRRWVQRLKHRGVEFYMNHRLTHLDTHPKLAVQFSSPTGSVILHPRAALLACGGASWPETGSDATWVSLLEQQGVRIVPLQPALGPFRFSPHVTGNRLKILPRPSGRKPSPEKFSSRVMVSKVG